MDMNNKAILGLVISLIILCICKYNRTLFWKDKFSITEIEPIRSQIDGQDYDVHTGHEDPQKAANILSKLNKKQIELLRHLRNKYIRGRPPYVSTNSYILRKNAVEKLLKRYNPDRIVENSSNDPDKDTSYLLNKDELLALCLRDKRSPGGNHFHDINLLTFVFMHELSHMAIDDIDHKLIFWRTFKFILQEAVNIGIYEPTNYTKNPEYYCRMIVDYDLLSDSNLIPI